MNEYDRALWNDAILPSQTDFMRGARTDDPYRRLWFAVLREAVYRYLTRPKTLKAARIRAEVATWLALDDDAPGSYCFICWALDIDPDFLRQGVYSARQRGESPFLRSEPRRSDHGIKIGELRRRKSRRVSA